MKQCILIFLSAMLVMISATSRAQSNTQAAPQPAHSASQEMLYQWNSIGKRLPPASRPK